MDRSLAPRELRPFLDESGRLRQWPTRLKVQRMAAALLAREFDARREYTEAQINELLLEHHTFGDWALLRRFLVDNRFLERETDGSRYRLLPEAPERIDEALGALPG